MLSSSILLIVIEFIIWTQTTVEDYEHRTIYRIDLMLSAAVGPPGKPQGYEFIDIYYIIIRRYVT